MCVCVRVHVRACVYVWFPTHAGPFTGVPSPTPYPWTPTEELPVGDGDLLDGVDAAQVDLPPRSALAERVRAPVVLQVKVCREIAVDRKGRDVCVGPQ